MQQIERSMNRAWLGEFLRSRRARLSPQDYGFPVTRRRRSPGLRRDEVAQLSGISVAYYTWIEQGRDINMSPEVLNAIARALGFSEAERTHLLTLAGIEVPESAVGDDRLHPTIAQIFSHHSSTWCAYLSDSWFNVLQATALATAVFGIKPGRELESNALYRLFADPTRRSFWADWETEAHMKVGMLRQALAKQPNSPGGLRLLDALVATPDFDRVWDAYDVRIRPSPDEFFRPEPWLIEHPEAGLLRIHRVATAIPARAEQILALYSPADDETARKLQGLLHRSKKRPDLFVVPA
jgi:hypothetical protein